MSEPTTEEIKEVIPPNVNLATNSTLDATVKTNVNLAPGLVPPPMLPPALAEYMRKVSKPFFIKHFNWTTSNEPQAQLLSFNVSPFVPFYQKDFVPYFAHEGFKWRYYRGSFIMRIVFLGSSAYRGTVSINRYFADTSNITTNAKEYLSNIHYHSIDGGNFVHTHHLRFSARGSVKQTVPLIHPIVQPETTFQDIYYENITIKVVSQLNAPSIFPTTLPVLILLEPQPDIEFFSRSNNLLPMIKYEPDKKVVSNETTTPTPAQ